MANLYHHTQIGTFILMVCGVALLWFGYLILVTPFNLLLVAALTLMLVAMALFATLTVNVSEHTLKLYFGLGIIRKNFPLQEVESYQQVKNPWYYGWGIRYTPRGWLFNVSGFTAIELQMRNGKRYRIGTDDPEGLMNALDAALGIGA